MAQLIDKTAVIAEIEKRQKEEVFYDEDGSFASWTDQYHYSILESIKNFINTFEVKEVDLEKEIKSYFDSQPIITRSKGIDYQLIPTGVDIAKHFFELGLKAQKGK